MLLEVALEIDARHRRQHQRIALALTNLDDAGMLNFAQKLQFALQTGGIDRIDEDILERNFDAHRLVRAGIPRLIDP